jgi:hypothetical protein
VIDLSCSLTTQDFSEVDWADQKELRVRIEFSFLHRDSFARDRSTIYLSKRQAFILMQQLHRTLDHPPNSSNASDAEAETPAGGKA